MLKTKSNFYKSSVYANCALLRVATSAQKVAVRLGRRWKTVVLGTSALSGSEASHGKPCQPRLGSVGLLAATRGIAGAFEYAYRLDPPPLPKPRTGRDSRMAKMDRSKVLNCSGEDSIARRLAQITLETRNQFSDRG
jgi:hypothetical protein